MPKQILLFLSFIAPLINLRMVISRGLYFLGSLSINTDDNLKIDFKIIISTEYYRTEIKTLRAHIQTTRCKGD